MLFQKIKQKYHQNLMNSYIENNDLISIKKILKSQFINNSNLEIAREDHALIMKKMKI